MKKVLCAVWHSSILLHNELPGTTHFRIYFRESDTAPLKTCVVTARDNLLYLGILLTVDIVEHEHTPRLCVADRVDCI
jgi:hypothetical protein